MTISITPGWNITPGTIAKDYNISDLFQFTTPTIISTANTFQTFSLAVNSNDTFVAVGSGSYITSKDGVTWSAPAYFNSVDIITLYGLYGYQWYSVASQPNGNLFVAVGFARYYGGGLEGLGNAVPIVSISTNGTTWTTPSIVSQNYLFFRSVAINSAGRSVAIGWDQFDYPISSTSTDGINWSTPTAIVTNRQINLNSIAVNSSNVFVAVGTGIYSNSYSFVSANGITWNTPVLMPQNTGDQIVWMPTLNKFFAAGYNGGSKNYSTSVDGINWSPFDQRYPPFSTVASNKNGYIVATYIPSQTSYYSVTSNVSNFNSTYRNFNSIGFAPVTIVSDSTGRFVVVGYNSNSFPMYSTSYNMLY